MADLLLKLCACLLTCCCSITAFSECFVAHLLSTAVGYGARPRSELLSCAAPSNQLLEILQHSASKRQIDAVLTHSPFWTGWMHPADYSALLTVDFKPFVSPVESAEADN